MKSATIKYLQSSFSNIKDIQDHGKKQTLFGNGTEDITFTRSGAFTDLSNAYNVKGVLEYRNVTIPEGISIVGNTFYGGGDSGSQPFYLKVNGTLTVNGSLNMNGTGQYGDGGHAHHHNHDYYYKCYTNLGFDLPMLDRSAYQLNKDNWLALYRYGVNGGFFDGKTLLVGAGNGSTYKWKRFTKYRRRHSYRCTNLNSSGTLGRSKASSGGGGGFIALYYENLKNDGPVWTDTQTDADTYGQTFYTNINCNGGIGGAEGAGDKSGGGCMIIAARNIVIGKNGSITSNVCHQERRSTGPNPIFGDSDYNAGLIGYMNRPGNSPYLLSYNFGKFSQEGIDMDLVGGPGVCFGYQVDPSYGGSI